MNTIYSIILIIAIAFPQFATGQDNKPFKKADSIFRSGFEHYKEKNYYQALINYHSALTLSTEIGYSSKKISCLKNIGVIYKQIGDYSTALNFYNDAASLLKMEKDTIKLARIYSNIGIVYRMMGEAASARDYFNKSLQIFTNKAEYKYQSRTENEIGITYEVDSLSDIARSWYLRSLTTARKVSEEYYNFKSAHVYNNIGWGYFVEGSDSCQVYYDKSLQYVKFAPDMAYYLYSNLSELYKGTDMETYYLEKTVDSYNTKEIHPFYIDALTQLSAHYIKVDIEKSKIYANKLSKVTKEQLELSKKISYLNQQYQVAAAEERIKKEDIARELAIQERNNTAIYISSMILFSFIIALMLIQYQNKKRRIDEILLDID